VQATIDCGAAPRPDGPWDAHHSLLRNLSTQISLPPISPGHVCPVRTCGVHSCSRHACRMPIFPMRTCAMQIYPAPNYMGRC
jgi:hypothetical protein